MNKWKVVEIDQQNVLFVPVHIKLKSRCGVVGCKKSNGKICVNVIVIYTNCGGNHLTNSPRYTSRLKVDIKAWKKKKV